ncbi:hypothetical protein EJ03DRAFT_116154 [Teratosphaeria nubilosa]|uniref:Uncharacterized protein n=1 Tax=Teratosphaeria nubilosa TaxID=161662 RepID=A0A6G1L738_9PEZI|nr:hypothetical protein EJ03DRAFT_116154 [Teratosphaeria nubilosa]
MQQKERRRADSSLSSTRLFHVRKILASALQSLPPTPFSLTGNLELTLPPYPPLGPTPVSTASPSVLAPSFLSPFSANPWTSLVASRPLACEVLYVTAVFCSSEEGATYDAVAARRTVLRHPGWIAEESEFAGEFLAALGHCGGGGGFLGVALGRFFELGFLVVRRV